MPLIANLSGTQFLVGFAGALVIVVAAYLFKSLSLSGAIGALAIGTIIFGSGGIQFAIPLLFFFISSSFLSKIKTAPKKNALIYSEKTGPRDVWQILANGGVGAVCSIIFLISGSPFWFFPYLASICEATADTWASEIGTLSPIKPISIVTLKKIETGQSGGVTILGIIASAAGSGATMLVSFLILSVTGNHSAISLPLWLGAANAGFAGSIMDSILGGSIQGTYQCQVCGQLVERHNHCGAPAQFKHGVRWVNNDMVNLISTIFSALMISLMLI